MTLAVVAPTIESLSVLMLCLSFQLHEHYDDLGRGGTEDSIASGDSGSRIACCAIKLLDGSEWN